MQVEDPNDSFTDMRDLIDVKRVFESNEFKVILPDSKFMKHVNSIRQKFKLSKVIVLIILTYTRNKVYALQRLSCF